MSIKAHNQLALTSAGAHDQKSLAMLASPNGLPRNLSRRIFSDLILVLTVAVAAASVYAMLASASSLPAGVTAAYAAFLGLLLFAFRSALDVFSTPAGWTKCALLGAVALLLAAALPIGAQESVYASATASDLLLLFAVAIAAPSICFLLAGGLVSMRSMQSRFCRRVAIYGATDESIALCETLRDAEAGFAFAGLFDDRRDHGRIENTVTPICGSLATLVRMVQSGTIDEVIICLPRKAAARTRQIADMMRGYPVNVSVVAHFVEGDAVTFAASNSLRAVGDAVLVQIHTKPIRGWSLAMKEGMDRICAALLLIGLSPIFALIAGAIKLDSAGPVFFRQRRHGLMGRTIVVWKFRTMTCTEDGAHVQQASKHDARVTKVGRILRKTSLDELPQLINVLFGEMSLVGPRPHAIAHNEHYGAVIERYNHRNQVKPGITGWAQVNGLRGETKDTGHMEARVAHDLAYIRQWSIWFDIKVLLLTPIYGFFNRNAY